MSAPKRNTYEHWENMQTGTKYSWYLQLNYRITWGCILVWILISQCMSGASGRKKCTKGSVSYDWLWLKHRNKNAHIKQTKDSCDVQGEQSGQKWDIQCTASWSRSTVFLQLPFLRKRKTWVLTITVQHNIHIYTLIKLKSNYIIINLQHKHTLTWSLVSFVFKLSELIRFFTSFWLRGSKCNVGHSLMRKRTKLLVHVKSIQISFICTALFTINSYIVTYRLKIATKKFQLSKSKATVARQTLANSNKKTFSIESFPY